MPVKYKMPVFVLGYTKYDYSQLCTRFVRCDEGRALVTSGGRVAHYAPGQKRDAFLWTARLQHITRPIGATMHNNIPPLPPPTPPVPLRRWESEKHTREKGTLSFLEKKRYFTVHFHLSSLFHRSTVFDRDLRSSLGPENKFQYEWWKSKCETRGRRPLPTLELPYTHRFRYFNVLWRVLG